MSLPPFSLNSQSWQKEVLMSQVLGALVNISDTVNAMSSATFVITGLAVYSAVPLLRKSPDNSILCYCIQTCIQKQKQCDISFRLALQHREPASLL